MKHFCKRFDISPVGCIMFNYFFFHKVLGSTLSSQNYPRSLSQAVNSLYGQRHTCHRVDHDLNHILDSPLKAWLAAHGLRSIQKFTKLFSEEDQQQSVEGKKILGGFKLNFGLDEFMCSIDPQNEQAIEDKLSQVRKNVWLYFN